MGKTRYQKRKKVVSKKVKSRVRIELEKKMRNPILRKLWDKNLSMHENYANLVISDFAQRCPESVAPRFRSIGEKDQIVVMSLLKKHKEDYAAMARDIKVNIFQWTASKCKYYIECYFEKKARVDAKIASLKAEEEGRTEIDCDDQKMMREERE